jgi:RNA polymerase sigma factor (sigma-70 family)
MVTTRTLAAELGAGLAPAEGASGFWDLLAPGAAARVDGQGELVGGDRVDWNDLMRRHGHRVVVSLLGRGVAVDRAKDLAQDAWMRIIAQHQAGRLPTMRVPGLVVAQALFLARDEARRRRRRDALSAPVLEARSDEPAQAHAPLERRVAAREDLRRVLEVVAASYPSARNVFALSYGPRALGPAEIAAELGLSCQRVRQIICELRKRLRDELRDESLDGPPAGGHDAR